jgi:hypothetical protein
MLIENSFFYISLPRCASTSFMGSCVKYGLQIQHFTDEWNIENQLSESVKELKNVDYTNFQHQFKHGHEPINFLRKKFGDGFDVISVKRNKYDRFFSLWKHILHEMDLKENKDTYDKCKNLSVDELLFYGDRDLLNQADSDDTVDDFIKKNNLNKITEYGKKMVSILIKPYSVYHLHDPNIIWFDFNELWKLEDWVSNKLNMDFKLIKTNSSNQYSPNFKNDEYFREKFDCIYSKYEVVKENKTLI